MKASDIMTLGAATTTPDSSLASAIRCMGDHRISALPVVDAEGNLRGILSEGDFFRRDGQGFRLEELARSSVGSAARALEGRRVAEIMTTALISVDGDAPIGEAIGLMERHGVKRLPVMAKGKLVGLISRADILRALLGE
jgi:CBS domain-containing protein